MLARDEYQAELAATSARGFVCWYERGQKTLAACSAEDVLQAGLNMLHALARDGVQPIDPAGLRRRLLRAAELLVPDITIAPKGTPALLREVPRAHGVVTQVWDNGDGTEDVVDMYGDRELERRRRFKEGHAG